jgi:hypothetical protein
MGMFQAWYFLRLGSRILEEHGGYTRKDIGVLVEWKQIPKAVCL